MPEREELENDPTAWSSSESESEPEPAPEPVREVKARSPVEFRLLYLTDLIQMLSAAKAAARETGAPHLLGRLDLESWVAFVYRHS